MLIKGFIFDIDGTLVDSSHAHLAAWRKALREFGIFKTDEEIVTHFGLKTSQISQNLASDKVDHATVIEIAALKTEYLLTEIHKLTPYPSVNQILQQIVDEGGKIVFVSNNFNRLIESMLDAFKWRDLALGFIGVDDVTHAKPDPEMVVKALKILNTTLEESMIMGDSIYDIQAGKAAGIKTIAICTKHSAESFSEIGPNLIVQEFHELKKHFPLDF